MAQGEPLSLLSIMMAPSRNKQQSAACPDRALDQQEQDEGMVVDILEYVLDLIQDEDELQFSEAPVVAWHIAEQKQ
jgi:hypothetical protein